MNNNGKAKSRLGSSPLSRWDAWAILQSAQENSLPLNGRLATSPSHVQDIARLLPKLPSMEARIYALQGFVAGLPEHDRKTIQTVDLKAGEPPDGPTSAKGRPLPARSPRLDSLIDPPSGYFLWMNRLVRGHINLISSEVKIGKTTLFMEFTRRLWNGEKFPYEEELILPANTHTLWVCGDKHHRELRDRAKMFGLPEEAVAFCAWPEEPRGNCSLDDEDTIRLMEHFTTIESPGIVFIDTIWRSTKKQMWVEEEVNKLLDPIIEIAQKTNTTILVASHLSKDGDTLGRRLEAVVRSVMKLYRPDPENQPDRRKLTTIGNFEQPPDLGITIYKDHIEFDHSPPKEPEQERKFGGRPRSESDEAYDFFSNKLQAGPQSFADLNKKWMASGGSRTTLYRVKNEMIKDQMLEIVVLEEGGPELLQTIEPTEPSAIEQAEWKGLLQSEGVLMD